MLGVTWVVLAASLGGAVQAQGIYSCVDGKGRRITADRPIAECVDRPQREINPSGTVKRVVGPSLTAQERAEQEQKDKAVTEARAREAEEKRRDRALLLRYPSRAVHNRERAEALEQIEAVIKAASKRTTELAEQRKAIDTDLEFYKSDPAKAPPTLKRKLEENDGSVAVQKRFIAEQDAEKKRVNLRFDEELVKLNQLWSMGGGVPDTAPAAAAVRK
ncbi:DUF4124 domain-containing protein [Polaromonas sp.]|uniref:DUF4124 domain-containing protein n=1 Tax=Polaromonas sp. TaxID=1869339 RepID=UPI003263963A